MQTVLHEKFVIDERGRRTAVLIDVKEYTKLLHLLEEARILKIINQGEKEYLQGKLKPIHSLSDLDKYCQLSKSILPLILSKLIKASPQI